MISDQGLKERVAYLVQHGKAKATEFYGLSTESLSRYVREARERGLLEDVDPGEDRKPNVLVLDIETTPLEVSAWRLGKYQITSDSVLRDRHLLSYAVKWLFEDQVYSDILTPEEAIASDDKRITQQVWEFVDHADIIIAHNGVRFDLSMLNARFITNGIIPPSPYQVIDTLLQVRKIASFTSNKQGFLNKHLKLTEKMEHEGLELWHRCVRGEEDALDVMLRYNEQDIMGLEELYITLRPWMRSHPNVSLYYGVGRDVTRCHRCDSENITWLNKKSYVTPMNRYSVYRCNECTGIGVSRETEIDKDVRKHLTKPLPR